MAESLILKWGTVKGWSHLSGKSLALMKQFMAEGTPSAMADRPDADRVTILCELIDQLNGPIWNDWDGEEMSKAAAKIYVLRYNQKK